MFLPMGLLESLFLRVYPYFVLEDTMNVDREDGKCCERCCRLCALREMSTFLSR